MEYFFHSDRVVEKWNKSPHLNQSFSYEDVREVELIQDEIISKFLGMEIVGIHAKESNIARAMEVGDTSWNNKPLSFDNIFKVIPFLLGGSHVKKNYMIRTGINKISYKYYQILLVLPKKESREIKEFIDQKIEIQ